MSIFNENDLRQIEQKGIRIEDVEGQVNKFISGFPAMKLVRAASVGDGIIKMTEAQLDFYKEKYSTASSNKDIIKFVPASGAASRMFKALFSFMNANLGRPGQHKALLEDSSTTTFFKGLTSFAFYSELKSVMASDGLNMEELIEDGHYAEILEYLLTEKGLDYGNLPKGLLSFHHYSDGNRTPAEEHLIEGASYAKGAGTVRIHFTVSEDHQSLFESLMRKVKSHYEKVTESTFEVTYSTQNPSSDTIAVTPANEPFRNEDGSLLFRPAGHGALLENLDNIHADLIFIKNIDNVVPDVIKKTTDEYKKALAGLLFEIQGRIHDYIKVLETASNESILDEVGEFLSTDLNIELGSVEDKKLGYLEKLKRPLRVCGMVVNTGEPGGGPFWCENSDGSISLQIVETSQIDTSDIQQEKILKSSTHFNPVDIIASTVDHHGEKFDLIKYRDLDTGFISSKSKDGRDLKAMELPGLWNGSMSDWNTILVEVPAITFNPVKTVNDLLREEHQ